MMRNGKMMKHQSAKASFILDRFYSTNLGARTMEEEKGGKRSVYE